MGKFVSRNSVGDVLCWGEGRGASEPRLIRGRAAPYELRSTEPQTHEHEHEHEHGIFIYLLFIYCPELLGI
jgi:hypothetical protein